MFFKNFKGDDLVTEVIHPSMHESGFGVNADIDLADLLSCKMPGRQADLVETIRHRSLVQVACGVCDLKEHQLLMTT